MGGSGAGALVGEVRDSGVHWGTAGRGLLRRIPRERMGPGDTRANNIDCVAISLGWSVHGGAGETRGGDVSEGMCFVSWRHAGGRWRRVAADRRNVFVELEWADSWGFVRAHSQDNAARVAGKAEQTAGRGRVGVSAELQQISGGQDGVAEAGGVFEGDSI